MGCNCATTVQLSELYKKYGTEKDKSENLKSTTFLEKAKKMTTRYGVLIVGSLFIPFIFIYVFYKGFRNKRINISKLFKLKPLTNVGKQ